MGKQNTNTAQVGPGVKTSKIAKVSKSPFVKAPANVKGATMKMRTTKDRDRTENGG
jgi:hypothetical protein